MSILLGIDIGGTKMVIASCKASEDTLVPCQKKIVPTGPSFNGDDIERVLLEYMNEGFAEPTVVSAAGVSIPGIVDEDSTVVMAPDVALKGHNIANCVRSALAAYGQKEAVQVHVDNDISTAACAYAFHPSMEVREAFQKETIIFAVIGSGIGTSFTHKGKLFGGARGWAGEAGISRIAGQKESLDALCGGLGLLERLGLTGEEVHDKIKENDKATILEVQKAGKALGFGLAMLTNIINPTMIVMGGGVCTYDGYVQSALKSYQEEVITEMADIVNIEVATYGRWFGLTGALYLAKFGRLQSL